MEAINFPIDQNLSLARSKITINRDIDQEQKATKKGLENRSEVQTGHTKRKKERGRISFGHFYGMSQKGIRCVSMSIQCAFDELDRSIIITRASSIWEAIIGPG